MHYKAPNFQKSFCKIYIKLHHLSPWWLEHTLSSSSPAEWSSVIWFALVWVQPVPPESVVWGRGEGGGGKGKSIVAPLFSHPRRRKQGCYNLFSWRSMKERGRATRALVRLDLLPLTPTVYLLSAISSFSVPLLFLLFILLAHSLIQHLPVVTLHHSSACWRIISHTYCYWLCHCSPASFPVFS